SHFLCPPTLATYTLSLHDALPIYVQKAARLGLNAQLRPGNNLADLFQGAVTSRHRYKCVGEVGHQCFALMHGLHYMQFRHAPMRSEEHTSELQSRFDLVCRLLLEK